MVKSGPETIAEANKKKSEKKQRGMRLIRGEREGVGGINEELVPGSGKST